MATPDEDNPGSHGVHGAARDDGKMQEEPEGSEGPDAEEWADRTETGGEAT